MTERMSPALRRWHFMMVALIGLVLMGGILLGSIESDLDSSRSRFADTIGYIKQQCAAYDNLNLASETKSLMRMIENVEHLRWEIGSDAENKADFVLDDAALEHYLNTHYLTGILLLSPDGQVEHKACAAGVELSELSEELERDTLLDTADYPEKIYSCRVEQENGSYLDLAACGRPDAPGVLVVYYHTSEEYVRNYNLSYQNIVESYRTDTDGTIVVTRGERIVASNDASLTGTLIGQTAVLEGMQNRARDDEMIHVRSDQEGSRYSFGMIERGRNFYVYIFRPERDVFASTPRNMFFAAFAYILIIFLVQAMRWKTSQRYREQQLLREQEYQKQLKAEAVKAEAANTAKTEFLQRMSHDIRTPINGIRGMVEIGNHYPEDAGKQAECRKKIWDASTLLLELVNEVLDMGKLESGEIVLESVPFDLEELLQEPRSVLEKPAAERGIRIIRKEPQLQHSHLIGSPLHVKRLLMNILSNAVKYNKDNGRIMLECREVRSDGDTAWICFVCEDTGIGMSEEFQKRMYEPFTQENSGARSTYGGTGLGMAITKSLVDRMGGSIEFTSQKDVGTTYTITLPFRIDHAAVEAKPQQSCAPDMTVLQGKRVLLAEDNALNMEIAEFLLSEAGVCVTKASDGRQAVETFRASEDGWFDAVLMDVMMPVMDGHEAARTIRSLPRRDAAAVPIVAMTANAFVEDRQKALDAGMTDYLTKPLESELVLKMLVKVCTADRPDRA